MTIERPIILNRLIQAQKHHLIKIITGIRRCGKSFLLLQLFKDHLISSGVDPLNIIEINLEHPDFHAFRNALALRDLIDKRMNFSADSGCAAMPGPWTIVCNPLRRGWNPRPTQAPARIGIT